MRRAVAATTTTNNEASKQATSKVNSITFVQYLHKQPKQNNMSYGGGYGGRYVT
jgi:hypothetical protein